MGETREAKTKLRDRVRVYYQHIWQPQYEQLKIKGHLRVWGYGEFWIFPFLKMRSQDTDLREAMKQGSSKNSKQLLNKL